MNEVMGNFMPIGYRQRNTMLLTLPPILRILARWQVPVLRRNEK
jgi:hypothetical protein